jgi:hypothetical protein
MSYPYGEVSTALIRTIGIKEPLLQLTEFEIRLLLLIIDFNDGKGGA